MQVFVELAEWRTGNRVYVDAAAVTAVATNPRYPVATDRAPGSSVVSLPGGSFTVVGSASDVLCKIQGRLNEARQVGSRV